MENDTLKFHTVDELRALSTDELRTLWELVPTDRQRVYKTAYEREVRSAGAVGSDRLEMQVNAELLRRYVETALVPVATRWARTPTRVQEAARLGESLNPPEDEPAPKPSVKVIFGFAAVIVLFLLVLMSGRGKEPDMMVMQPTDTPTPQISPTPTPLALEAQDEVIEGGDPSRAVAYPVSLQVTTSDGQPPRLWVVQRRKIETSEWHYDDNPDTASFVNGMSVRPVIGIPWSEENAGWFEQVGEGTVFTLTMNTGAVLHYEFGAKTEVSRSDTGIFRQVSPGLVLLLLGETDAEGFPTAIRMLITAHYPPEQELSRSGELVGLSLPMALTTLTPTFTSTPESKFAGVHVDLISATYTDHQLTTQLRIYNGRSERLHIVPDDIWLSLGYTPHPPGPRISAADLLPFDLLPDQAADLKLIWYRGEETFGNIGIGDYLFAMQF